MKLDVQIDMKQLEAKTLREAKRLAYSTVQALNKTATEIQTAERKQIAGRFTVRKETFINRLVKVAFASVLKDRAEAEVYIDNTKKRVLLGLFEEGGTRDAAKGQNVAVPITGEAARPTFASSVITAFTFTKLRFKPRDGKAGGKTVFEGQQNTFLIPGVGVFQRIGQKATELIYAFIKPMKLDKRLGFLKTAEKIFNDRFKKNFDDAYNSKKVD